MPLYEYRCLKCGVQREKIQKFSDPVLTTCEKCGGQLERLVSSAAIQFKGSGWYVTDYARKSAPAESGKTESSSSNETKKTSEPSAVSKPSDSKPSSKT